eukprot:607210-Amphidinium_carterae.6
MSLSVKSRSQHALMAKCLAREELARSGLRDMATTAEIIIICSDMQHLHKQQTHGRLFCITSTEDDALLRLPEGLREASVCTWTCVSLNLACAASVVAMDDILLVARQTSGRVLTVMQRRAATIEANAHSSMDS